MGLILLLPSLRERLVMPGRFARQRGFMAVAPAILTPEVAAGGGGPTQLASDSFTAASDQALTTYSAAWSYVTGSFTVIGAADDVRSDQSSTLCIARRNDVTPNADQYSQFVFTTGSISSNVNRGVAVRCASGAVTCYRVDVIGGGGSGNNYLQRIVAGDDQNLAIFNTSWAAGDVCRLKVSGVGSTVTVTVQKALAASPTSFSDVQSVGDTNAARITTAGYLGFTGYGNSTGASGGLDDWAGGNL